jgi:hypothetical protein
MGKMPGMRRDARRDCDEVFTERELELRQLAFRQGMEKAFQDDDTLAQAGIQIIVGDIQDIPIQVRARGQSFAERFNRRFKILPELFHHFGQGGNLVKELRTLGKKDAAEEAVEASNALTSRVLEILRIQWAQAWCCAEVTGVKIHGSHQARQRGGKPAAKSGSNSEELVGHGDLPMAAHAQGFIQIHTEHAIGCFKLVKGA